jgi:hypothetical protein
MSRPAILAVPTSVSPGPLPPCGHPGSPGCRTPIRTSKVLGTMPRLSNRPLSCLATSGVPQSTEIAGPPGGSASLPAEMVLQLSVSHGVACCSLPSGSRALCRRPRSLRSGGIADRAGTVASHESGTASPLASCPERSGSRRGRVLSCSRIPDTAVASLALTPVRRSRPMPHCRPPRSLWRPSWPPCSSFFQLGSWPLPHSEGHRSAVVRRTPLNIPRPQSLPNSATRVAPSRLQVVAPLAQWSPCGGSHSHHRTSLPARSGGRRQS